MTKAQNKPTAKYGVGDTVMAMPGYLSSNREPREVKITAAEFIDGMWVYQVVDSKGNRGRNFDELHLSAIAKATGQAA